MNNAIFTRRDKFKYANPVWKNITAEQVAPQLVRHYFNRSTLQHPVPRFQDDALVKQACDAIGMSPLEISNMNCIVTYRINYDMQNAAKEDKDRLVRFGVNHLLVNPSFEGFERQVGFMRIVAEREKNASESTNRSFWVSLSLGEVVNAAAKLFHSSWETFAVGAVGIGAICVASRIGFKSEIRRREDSGLNQLIAEVDKTITSQWTATVAESGYNRFVVSRDGNRDCCEVTPENIPQIRTIISDFFRDIQQFYNKEGQTIDKALHIECHPNNRALKSSWLELTIRPVPKDREKTDITPRNDSMSWPGGKPA